MELIWAIAGALIGSLVGDAFEWLPRLTRRIVKAAARRLSANLQDRMEEEWLRYVEDIPGKMGPLIAACQCLLASVKIRPIRIDLGLHVRIAALFRPRDIFLHDGKSLRRFTIGPRIQAVAASMLLLLIGWTTVATISAFRAMDADVAQMEREVSRMSEAVNAKRVPLRGAN